MLSIEPIVYSRTFSVDYRFWAVPETLRNREDFDIVEAHIRHVMWDEDPVYPMTGRRWHVMTVCGKILVGMAGYESGRVDSSNVRPIRGYYGILMDPSSVFKPSVAVLRHLDDIFVMPHFHAKVAPERLYCSEVEVKEEDRIPVTTTDRYEFNVRDSILRFFDEKIPEDDLLNAAITKAKVSPRFEFVYGLNSKDHAMKLSTMNVLCFGVASCDVPVLSHSTTDTVLSRPALSKTTSCSRENTGMFVRASEILKPRTQEHKKRLSLEPSKTSICKVEKVRERIEISVECDVGMRHRISDLFDRIIQVLKLIPGVSCIIKRSCGRGGGVTQQIDSAKNNRRTTSVDNPTIDFSFGLKINEQDDQSNIREW